MKVRNLLLCAAVCLAAMAIASAQDAAKVDPAHYKVEFENSQVRILRVHYGPHEKSVMHSHPAGVVVYLTDGTTRFTMPDGKTEEVNGKKGEARYTPAVVHLPEDVGDKPFDAVVIEMKARKTPAAHESSKK
jgi:quercetin dioxygenase-like cupin family protein